MQIIRANGLSKSFGGLKAVDGISFNVEEGEIFAILGENGAGKSTTMRMIACRSPLSDGELLVNSLDVGTNARAIRSLIGVVPQENNLDPDLNVMENLLVYSRYFRIPSKLALAKSKELLDFVGLNDKFDCNVEKLSGGMKRRLIIARALIHEPKILLLDEPTTGLDPNVRHEIWEKLEELRIAVKLTIVMSTHYMEEAEKLCQRLIVMSKGKIIAHGTPADLISENVKRFVLEVREASDIHMYLSDKSILARQRGSVHLYFAATSAELIPLMDRYGSRPMLLRPSNLEDVFLHLLDDDRSNGATRP